MSERKKRKFEWLLTNKQFMGISTIIKLSLTFMNDNVADFKDWSRSERKLPGKWKSKSISAPLGGKSAVASCRFNMNDQTMQAEEKGAHISCSDCRYSHIDTLLTNRVLHTSTDPEPVCKTSFSTREKNVLQWSQSLTNCRQTFEVFQVSSGKTRRLQSGWLSRDRRLKLL